nr:hypothetical protein [Tanacetum cinerariifolium]
MDDYRDEGIGDVIFDNPFSRDVGIKTRWSERMITIYNGNDDVTYQMVRSHPRFKNHTNEQCNKIPPLLKTLDLGLVYLFETALISTMDLDGVTCLSPKNEELPKELSIIIMIVKMVKLLRVS